MKQINIRFCDEEENKINAISQRLGTSKTNLCKMMISKGLEQYDEQINEVMNFYDCLNNQNIERKKTQQLLKKITWKSNVIKMLSNLRQQGVKDKELLKELIPQLKKEGETFNANTEFLTLIVDEEIEQYKEVKSNFILIKE